MADKIKLDLNNIKDLPKMIMNDLREIGKDMLDKISNKASQVAPNAKVPPKPTLDKPWPHGTLKKNIRVSKKSEFKDLKNKSDSFVSDL